MEQLMVKQREKVGQEAFLRAVSRGIRRVESQVNVVSCTSIPELCLGASERLNNRYVCHLLVFKYPKISFPLRFVQGLNHRYDAIVNVRLCANAL